MLHYLKKKKSKTSLFFTLNHYKIHNIKLSTINISNTKNDFQTWFWNKSVNENNSDSKKESNHENDRNNKNLKKKHSKTEKKTSSRILKQELK